MAFCLSFPKINICGPGALGEVATELRRRDFRKPLIVTERALVKLGLVSPLVADLKTRGVIAAVYDGVVPNPTIREVDEAFSLYELQDCDCLIGFGGGSSIDTAKAVRILSANPGPITRYYGDGKVMNAGSFLVAVNTTAGTAAEVTANAIILDPAVRSKMIIRDLKIIPDISVNDPELMRSLPPDITAATGMDALTHAIEAYVSRGAHALTDIAALEAIRIISKWLPQAVADGTNITARGNMAQGEFLAGIAFNSAGLGAVHAMAHQPGAMCNLPHGLCAAILLPVVCSFNRPHTVERFARIAGAMGVDCAKKNAEAASLAAIEAIKALSRRVGVPKGFSEFGVVAAELPAWVQKAQNDPCVRENPVPMSDAEMLMLFREAL